MDALPESPELDEAVDLGPLETLVGYHLRRAGSALRSDYARTVGGAGLRQVLFGILSVISANPGINQGSVARVLGIQRPNMVALVAQLIDEGLVTRAVDASDRRAFVLTMTPAGNRALAATLERIHRHEERLLAGLSREQRALLIDMLGRVAANGD